MISPPQKKQSGVGHNPQREFPQEVAGEILKTASLVETVK